ncbi:hypothetical protein GCM10010234_80740 [Streptomyces hawaiiensis]
MGALPHHGVNRPPCPPNGRRTTDRPTPRLITPEAETEAQTQAETEAETETETETKVKTQAETETETETETKAGTEAETDPSSGPTGAAQSRREQQPGGNHRASASHTEGEIHAGTHTRTGRREHPRRRPRDGQPVLQPLLLGVVEPRP